MVNPAVVKGSSVLKIKYTLKGMEMKNKIRVRQATLADVPQLLRIDKEIWLEFNANAEMFQSRIITFPEGQFVAVLADGQVVGSVFTQLIDYKDWENKNFTWDEVTDNGTLRRTHNPKGDSVYGVGLAVVKKFQGVGVSERLLIAVAGLTIRENYRRVILGARIPGYCRHSDIPAEDYIVKTRGKIGRLLDPELAFYQKYGGKPVKPLPNYIPDSESLGFGVLVNFKNPFHNKFYRKVVAWFLRVCPSVVW